MTSEIIHNTSVQVLLEYQRVRFGLAHSVVHVFMRHTAKLPTCYQDVCRPRGLLY